MTRAPIAGRLLAAFPRNVNRTMIVAGFFSSSPVLAFYDRNWTQLANPGTIPASVSFITCSSRYAAVSTGNTCYIYDVSGLTPTFITSFTPLGSTNISHMEFDPTGAYLAVSGIASPFVDVFETSSWTSVCGSGGAFENLKNAIQTLGYSSRLAWRPDGARIVQFGMTASPYLNIFDATAGGTIMTAPTQPASRRLKAKFAGGYFFCGSGLTFTPTISFYDQDLNHLSDPSNLSISSAITDLDANADGSILVAGFGSPDNAYRTWSRSGSTLTADSQAANQPTTTSIAAISMSDDGKVIAAGTNASTGNTLFRFSVPSYSSLGSLAWGRLNGNSLAFVKNVSPF